jgi:hypothetical protein
MTASLAELLPPRNTRKARFDPHIQPVARMERSYIRERSRVLLCRPRIFASLNPGYKMSLRQMKSAPVSALGQGVALISSLPSPSQSRGMARRQGAMPGLLRARCPDCSGRMGVKRHAPRLAARQRGILAFVPLTVVGPGRLLLAGEAARVRPGDEVASSIARRCRSRSPPAERLRKAPLEEWIGMSYT